MVEDMLILYAWHPTNHCIQRSVEAQASAKKTLPLAPSITLQLALVRLKSDWGITLELRIIFGVQEPLTKKLPSEHILYVQTPAGGRLQPPSHSSKPPSSTQRRAPSARSCQQPRGTGDYVRPCGGVLEEAVGP
jgi:hypothetical protein